MRSMKVIMPCAALALLSSCASKPATQSEHAAQSQMARYMVDRSVIVCSDGNQVRMAFSGNLSISWNVLDDFGHPRRCTRKRKTPTHIEYEEVPE